MGGKSFNLRKSDGYCDCYDVTTKTCSTVDDADYDQYDIVDPFGQYEYFKNVNMFYSDYAGGNNGAERAYYKKESYHAVGEYECEQKCEASSDCHAYINSGSNCWLRKNVQMRNVKSGSYTAMVKDKRFALGHSDLSVTLEECFNYADIYKMESKELYDDKQYKGCFHGDDNIMYYNYMGTECKERCLYRNELDNAPIVVDGDTMVIGKRMSAEVFRPYARSCVEWEEFETNDKLRPRGCFQKDNQVNYNNAPSATWKIVDYGADSDTQYLHSDFVSVSASSLEECLTACDSYPFASYASDIQGCRCANIDSGAGTYTYGTGVYTKNEITCSQEYKCVDDNDRKSYNKILTIEGLLFNRKVKNPEAICIADGSEEAELKAQAPVLEALREYNDECNFLLFSGTCDKVATWEECKRYGATTIESLADKPNGCYLMNGNYHFNEIGGVCTEDFPCYCRTDQYKDILTGRCKEISENPIIKSIVYQDRDTDKEIQTELECQVNSDKKITCAQCECFADYTYGTWGGGMCETCAIGYGKSQCSTPCDGFDGLNRDTMCGGFGNCLFGSSISGVERIFQNTECMCGQEDQYQQREPEHSNEAYFKASKQNFLFYDYVTNGKTYQTIEEAKLECEKYNDLRFIAINKYCFGVFIEDQSNLVYELHMGKVGTEFVNYFLYIEKALKGSTSLSLSIQELEFTNLIPELGTEIECYDDITISLQGRDICNHFSSDTTSCTECADGFTGKNCRAKCQNCLLGGECAEKPGEEDYAACICPTGNLWEHQCCPAGFKVVELLDWSNLPKSKVNRVKIQSIYDPYTNNEKDAAYYCKKCPGLDVEDWMSDVAEFKVCSGETRGDCIISGNALACACKLNDESGMTWRGRACSCDDNIVTPYSSDPKNAETTDYGCLIPTAGTGMCPDPDSQGLNSYYFYPKQVYALSSHVSADQRFGNVVGGTNYIGTSSQLLSSIKWNGGVAGTIFVAVRSTTCTPKYPCHTGEGECTTDDDCAGGLLCSDRTININGYDPSKVQVTLNFCYDPNLIMVGCDPIIQAIDLQEGDGSIVKAAYNYKYWDGQTFVLAPENHYVPMTKDANANLIIHKRAFPCPIGRYGTVWDGIRECALCPPGSYQDQTGTGDPACKLCIDNCLDGTSSCTSTAYGAGGAEECVSCDRGQETINNVCTDCSPGYYEVGGSCAGCALGKYTNQFKQYGSCKECAKGYYTSYTNSQGCKECEAGRYNDVVALDQNHCNDCIVGKYQNERAQDGCKGCANGHYQDLQGKISCKATSNGYRVRFGGNNLHVNQDVCNGGQYSDGHECQACQVGKFSTSEGAGTSTGVKDNSCHDCVDRTELFPGTTATTHQTFTRKVYRYQPSTGQTKCEECGHCQKTNDDKTACVESYEDQWVGWWRVGAGKGSCGNSCDSGPGGSSPWGRWSGNWGWVRNYCFNTLKIRHIADPTTITTQAYFGNGNTWCYFYAAGASAGVGGSLMKMAVCNKVTEPYNAYRL
tara:strand:- start:16975 stop:21465 length:4491 start_codon:yes stop_codon:yes gene_type:complete